MVQGEVELRPSATRRTVCVFAIRRVHDENWLQEARHTNFFLLMEELHIIDYKGEQRWGLVFAQLARLQTLTWRGWFT